MNEDELIKRIVQGSMGNREIPLAFVRVAGNRFRQHKHPSFEFTLPIRKIMGMTKKQKTLKSEPNSGIAGLVLRQWASISVKNRKMNISMNSLSKTTHP